ncbi:MAG: DoxX family protein [Planctomycetota bacterium]
MLSRLDATGIPLLIARLVVGGRFVQLGLKKIQDPQAFLKAVKAYEVLPLDPPVLINSIAVLLPWLEVVAGVLIVLGVGLRGAGVISFISLVVFTGAVAARAFAIYGASDIGFCAIKFDCGCGTGEVFICPKLVENSLLILGSIPIFASGSRLLCLRKDGARYAAA